MKKPCADCGTVVWVDDWVKHAAPKCHRCRGNVPGGPVEPKYCRWCGVDVPRGYACGDHKLMAQCGGCGELFQSANPYRESTKTYCSEDCRISAGVLANGVCIGTSTDLGWRECVCGGFFCHPSRKTCKPECSKIRFCPDCPAVIAKGRQRCDDCRYTREKKRKRATKKKRPKLGNFRRRARHHGVPYEPVNRREVYERDNWTCGICHDPVDENLKYPDPMSASLDHIIPMARGGPHSFDNTQCAHWICNSLKSDSLVA